MSSSAATQTKWKGLSSNWNDPSNWDNGVPNSGLDAVISVGSATGNIDPIVPPPTATDSSSVNNLNVQSGGNMRFATGGGLLIVWGSEKLQNDGAISLGSGIIIFKNKISFMNGGTFDGGSGTLQFEGVVWENKTGSSFSPGTSTVIFNGDSSQIISGSVSFYNLQIYTTGTLSIDGSVQVLHNATVSSSSTVELTSGDSLLVEGVFDNCGTVSGGTVIAPTLLPVQMQTLSVSGSALSASLQWQTATEIENYGFAIERRTVDRVGSSWKEIGFVAGSGTSSSPHAYSFDDNNLSAGRYAYRIKQIDHDGTFQYYGNAEVVVGLVPNDLSLGQNFPNPFNPSTEIVFSIPRDGNATVSVYDVAGREISRIYDGAARAGQLLRATFDGSKFASGVYFSVLRFDSKVLSRKMLMMK
jgi:hypothetical protein